MRVWWWLGNHESAARHVLASHCQGLTIQTLHAWRGVQGVHAHVAVGVGGESSGCCAAAADLGSCGAACTATSQPPPQRCGAAAVPRLPLDGRVGDRYSVHGDSLTLLVLPPLWVRSSRPPHLVCRWWAAPSRNHPGCAAALWLLVPRPQHLMSRKQGTALFVVLRGWEAG